MVGSARLSPTVLRSVSTAGESQNLTWREVLAAHPSTPVDIERSIAVLIHRGATGRAQIALFSLQAGRDGTHVGDFARTESIDIRCAGPPLFGGALIGRGRTGRNQCESDPERQGSAMRGEICNDLYAHGSGPPQWSRRVFESLRGVPEIRETLLSKCEFSHTCGGAEPLRVLRQ